MVNMKQKGLKALALLLALTLAAVLSGCATGTPALSVGSDKVGEEYFLTIDGYGVTEEEFQLFLRDQKAAASNYFWANYQLQADAEFWTTEINGENPLRYAKERALDALLRDKVEFIMAAERSILEYHDYDALMENMAAENADRARKLKNGEVFYGVTEYTPFTYYQYVNTNLRSELEYAQEELSNPTRKQLMETYEANKDLLDLGTVYEFDVYYADGREEQVSMNTREIGKEDTTSEDLFYNYFAYLEPGGTVPDYSYHGEQADIVFRSATHQGYQTFEQAEDSLRVFFARAELSRLIQEQVEAAVVEMDQARFDAIEMS